MPNPNFTDVEVRVVELRIKEQSLWEKITKESNLEIKVFSSVSDGISDKSFNIELNVMPVKEGHRIGFGPAGYTIYRNRAGQVPRFLDVNITVLEDDSDIRNTAKLMSEVRATEDFQKLVTTIAAASANPLLGVGLNVADSLMNIGLKLLQDNGDDLLLRRYFSFNYNIDGFEGAAEFESEQAYLKLQIYTG